MTCEALLMFERFVTLVALEWFFPSVLPHVLLQLARSNASIVALVAFERLLSCVLSHHVNFQLRSCNARKRACCASVWLFTRVRLLVPLQVACICCFVFTLIAVVQWLFSSLVLSHHVKFQLTSFIAGILAQCASVWLFTRVRFLVALQVA